MTYTINSDSNIVIQSSSPMYVVLNADTILDSSLVTYTSGRNIQYNDILNNVREKIYVKRRKNK